MAELYRRIDESFTPHGILGIPTNSTHEEVRAAYKALALQLHPDKCDEFTADLHKRLFVKVKEAQDIVLEWIEAGIVGDEEPEMGSEEGQGQAMSVEEMFASLVQAHRE